MSRRNPDLSVYLVIGRADCRAFGLEDTVAKALAGGATLVQLREKELPPRDYLELARSLLTVLEKAGVPLVVNDRVEEALELGAAEGRVALHVGQRGLPWPQVWDEIRDRLPRMILIATVVSAYLALGGRRRGEQGSEKTPEEAGKTAEPRRE